MPTRAVLPAKLAAASWSPPPSRPSTFPAGTRTASRQKRGVRWERCPRVSNACSKIRPLSGRGIAIIEMAREGSSSGSVRQTTVSRSAPCPSHPVAEDIHCFRPEMTHSSPTRRAVVRTPSSGGGDPALALPPGSVDAKAASGAPLVARKVGRNRRCCSGVPPTTRGASPSTVESRVSETRERQTEKKKKKTKNRKNHPAPPPPPPPPPKPEIHLRRNPSATSRSKN